MALHDISNFREVSHQLATAGQPSVEQMAEVAQSGYQVVINLGLMDQRYCLADEAGTVRSLGMAYHWIPVDFARPTQADLDQFMQLMNRHHGQRILVHCAANFRVTAFVSIYGQANLAWTQEHAEQFIRSVWQPNEIWTGFLLEARRRLRSQEADTVPAHRIDALPGVA